MLAMKYDIPLPDWQPIAIGGVLASFVAGLIVWLFIRRRNRE
jgi:hypothetical protein